MPINKEHRAGIKDLLLHEKQNRPVLLQLAKSVTKSVCEITSERDALDYLFAYIDDIHTLLGKRHITKELLFKYLHSRHIASVSTDFSKADLIKHIIRYWNKIAAKKSKNNVQETRQNTNAATTAAAAAATAECNTVATTTTIINKTDSVANNMPSIPPTSTTKTTPPPKEANFPINLLARQFSEWFFDNYNKGNLKLEDFWSDAQLHLRIMATDGLTENDYTGAMELLQALMASKLQFGFYFNPNLTYEGVQGRMDSHGLVLVLACGTLHTQEKFVGVFECVFGLLRDPFSENNWKTKRLQCVLRSELAQTNPCLLASNSLQQALTLPIPDDADLDLA